MLKNINLFLTILFVSFLNYPSLPITLITVLWPAKLNKSISGAQVKKKVEYGYCRWTVSIIHLYGHRVFACSGEKAPNPKRENVFFSIRP